MVGLSSTRLHTSNTAAGRARLIDSQVRAGVLRTVNTAVTTADRLSSEMTARPQSESSSTGSRRITRICTASRKADGCLRRVAPHRAARDGGSLRSSQIDVMATLYGRLRDNAGMPSALLLPVLTCAVVLLVSGVAKLRDPASV